MATDPLPSTGIDELVRCLDSAVAEGDVHHITQQVKSSLEELVARRAFRLPSRFLQSNGEHYARRLLHHSASGYTVVVMAWGPGQGTQLHDHAGLWCVECVVDGQLEVTQFELLEQQDSRYRFSRQNKIVAGVGDAGSLIPPWDYHILSNARSDGSSVTLHVYGGDMECCNLFVPTSDGWWKKETRQLQYDH